jgi:hypothetical protein
MTVLHHRLTSNSHPQFKIGTTFLSSGIFLVSFAHCILYAFDLPLTSSQYMLTKETYCGIFAQGKKCEASRDSLY